MSTRAASPVGSLGRAEIGWPRAADPIALIHWSVIAAIVLLDATSIAAGGYQVRGIWHLAAALGMLAAVHSVYGRFGRQPRLGHLALLAARLLSFFAAGGVLSYLATATALPFVDAELARLDAALGFDWLRWFEFVQSAPSLHAVLAFAYASTGPEIVAVLLYVSLAAPRRTGTGLLSALFLTLVPTIAVSALLPAESAWVHWGVGDRVTLVHMPDMAALRDGSMRSISLTQIEGLITFPSFHTSLAVLLTWAARDRLPVLLAAMVLNGAMLLSVPSEGGHYLVDMIAGAGLAASAIVLAERLERASSGRTPPQDGAISAAL
jgi:hypothetical protein